jgi:DMSO/TMAO reductase YedYZ molybdopterin-dependent catalytic subunit
MLPDEHVLTRRKALKLLGATGSAVALSGLTRQGFAAEQESQPLKPIEPFTGPGENPHWNSLGPYVAEPQKAPLILLTDRPVQLETPRHYFVSAFTPNEAFYVRWHLDNIPNEIDLKEWKLRVEGNVAKPAAFSLPELAKKFKEVSVAAVNQCSGNSRSRLQPRVAGGQWGNGAMGNALWTGVRLREILDAAGIKPGSTQVQFQGLETGAGPKGMGSREFQKSLNLTNPVIDECVVAYLMNGEPMPLLNGFPMRLVLDEDRVPHSGYTTRKHDTGRNESRHRQDGADRADAGEVIRDHSGWLDEDSCGHASHRPRNRVQWRGAGCQSGTLRRRRQELARRETW